MSKTKTIIFSSTLIIISALTVASFLYIQVNSLESQILNLHIEIITLENEVTKSYNTGYDAGETIGYTTGYEEGYTQGLDDGAGRGWNIRDPSYVEAIAFMTSDTTDENEYTNNYECWNFVADFKNNAFNSGYRAGDVYIEFVDSAHAITCFDTTDNGLIFIEPQFDQIVTLTIGGTYWDRTIYETPDYDDTVINYVIIW